MAIGWGLFAGWLVVFTWAAGALFQAARRFSGGTHEPFRGFHWYLRFMKGLRLAAMIGMSAGAIMIVIAYS